jgi:phosphatidate cytidylyltransferase
VLKQRVITGLLLGLAVLGLLLFLPPVAFQAFAGLALLIGAWEWTRLAGLGNPGLRLGYVVLIAALMALLYLHEGSQRRVVLLAACLWWVFAFYLIRRYPAVGDHWRNPVLLGAVGLLVLLPGWTALLHLGATPWQNHAVLVLLLLVAAADIGAYFAGRAFGSHKLAPNVSPNKTWEGLVGGVLLCCVLALAVWFWWLPAGEGGLLPALRVLASALSLAVFSVVGDLFESMIKRQAGIKDSGSILPGHGGVLDRLDSVTAGLPLYALALPWVLLP